MTRYTVARRSFDATHYDEAETHHLHGHHFTVEVTDLSEVSSIASHLEDVCRELHLHRLDEMLVGGSQTGQGIASWIMERLLINHPKITRVEVWWNPDLRYGVTREIR